MEENEYRQLIFDLEERIAAGDAQAMKWMGDLYYQGFGDGKSDENINAALPYWRLAADYGYDGVAGKVGASLMKGIGCEKDEAAAMHYLVKAADFGDVDMQYWVGLCYLDGVGAAVNSEEGERYLRMAALRNHSQAQLSLSQYLLKKEDGFSEAIHWMCCAHLNGAEEATNGLKIVMKNPNNAELVREQLEYIRKNGVKPPVVSPSSSEGCYIATAVYGSYDAPEVMTLRKFRDHYLKKRWWGRWFIKIYYYMSPSIAEKLKNRSKINSIIRQLLDKFISKC